jgi:hypothetical protein
MARWVVGKGINDIVNGSLDHKVAYSVWKNMLIRCYDHKYQRMRPSYIGCSVTLEWLTFSVFLVWFKANHKDGFQLDKDCLIPGNKLYSPDTCVFVPPRVNSILTDRAGARGPYPLGVNWNTAVLKFVAKVTAGDVRQHLGCFDTAEEAHAAYRVAKRAEVKRVAIEAFLNNEIKSDVYLALVRREF